MCESLKNFSINDVKMYREQKEDPDFSIVEIWAMGTGNNSHKNPISESVLKQCSETFRGKFITVKYNEFSKDATTHMPTENIAGYIDPNSPIEFKSKTIDGEEKLFVVVQGVLSKIYCKEIVDMFRLDNERTVSCEFSCGLTYEENEFGRAVDEFGKELYVDNPITSYCIHSITILGRKYNPSIKGTEIKVKQFAEQVSSKDKALQLANQLIDFANTLSEKEFSNENLLDIDSKDKEELMEDEKKLSESTNTEEDIIMAESEENKEEVIKEEEMAEPKSEEEPKDEDKEMSCGGEDKEMAEESKENEDDNKSEDSDKEMAESEDSVEEDKEDKKFSLKEYFNEDMINDSNKEFAEKVAEFSEAEIANELIKLFSENLELKAEKEKIDMIEKEKRFSAIMANVKEDLDEKVFAELSEEGKELSLEQLGAFENKVKAFAYEATKKHKDIEEDTDVMMFANSEQTNIEEEKDVFVRISKM